MDSASHQNSHTFYLKYEGPLPATSNQKEIKVDITITLLQFLLGPSSACPHTNKWVKMGDFMGGLLGENGCIIGCYDKHKNIEYYT